MTGASAAAISLRDVSKRYNGHAALQTTDLEVASGKTTALIGPSGCGKSTLLRLIVGLIEPSSGSVEVEGARVSASSVQVLRRRMGYVIQDGGLFPHIPA